MTEPALGPDGKPYPERGLKKLVCDLFTGPDGETWAMGRLSALPILGTGISTPFVMIWKGSPLSLMELGALLVSTAAAITTLVRGTNNAEPPGPGEKR